MEAKKKEREGAVSAEEIVEQVGLTQSTDFGFGSPEEASTQD